MRRIYLKISCVIFIVICISACGWFKSGYIGLSSPEALYQRGYEYYHKGKYDQAIEVFQRVTEEYPLSKLALMAELGVADSYFSDEHYDEAEMSYSDFMNFHPTNENLPYVMYQIGMCHYNQMSSIDRDQSQAVMARESFTQLMTRFPSSKFAFMGEKKLRESKKRLGEHEFYVGQFYFKREQYNAALQRFTIVAREYENLGMDYKVSYYIEETKRRLSGEQAEEKE